MKPDPSEVATKPHPSVGRQRLAPIGCVLLGYAIVALPAERDRISVATTYSVPTDSATRLVEVTAGTELQRTLQNARAGDVIELSHAASLAPARAWIEIRSLSPGGQNDDRPVFSVVEPAPRIAWQRAAPLERAAASAVYFESLPIAPQTLRFHSATGLSGTGAAERGWPMRGNDAANSGHTAASGPAAQTEVLWSFRPDAQTSVWRPAVAADGTIYVTTARFLADGVDGRLIALWPDGSVKWQAQLTSSAGRGVWTSTTPVVDSAGNVYVAWAHDVGGGGLTAMAFDDGGNLRWRFEPNLELASASHQQPVLGDGVVYAAANTDFFFGDPTHRASIFALDLATGTPLWHWRSPNLDTFFDGPVLGHDGYLYHASAANPLRGAPGYLYRIRPGGELDWSVDVGVGVYQAPPIDARNNIYLGDSEGVVAKYTATGDLSWTYDTLSGQIYASPVLNGSRVTVGAAGGLHVLDVDTGQLDEVFAPGEYPFGQASDSAGNAFFYSFNPGGPVFGFGRGGRQWWRFDTGVATSVNAIAIAGDGSLLVSNGETLQAYVAPVLGDLNCSGTVDLLDVGPFVIAALDPGRYARRYPQCHRSLADANGDGEVAADDFVSFLRLIG